ncbi:serine protease snake-like [Spodoptera frugiperda]|uniref:Serine protease snake-like n=1 Tax=Spodoptera frugiperda TaxID=7108 RepID=A0A9R0F5I1_SPOFR|nr:serine protease snake-like [Spodoptera frugiperda]
MLLKLIINLCLVVYSVVSMYEGDRCIKKDGTDVGTCTIVTNCPAALEELDLGETQPQICSFPSGNRDPIVCCFNNPNNSKRTTQRPPIAPSRITNEQPRCSPLHQSTKTKQVAFNKCLEYQEKYVYPCVRGTALTGGYGRANYCHHASDQLVAGGTNAGRDEFPHMVLIGFGDSASNLGFKCGGSIISERFVLTAAHCSFSPKFGYATFIAIGVLHRDEAKDQSKIYSIKRFINHPHYKSPSKYDDIALIETDREMKLDQFTVPACLPTEPVDDARAIATGWGATHYNTQPTDILQKVILYKTPVEECSRLFRSHRLFRRGFNEETQTCYGDRELPTRYQDRYESKDTCPGDSGGPLQIKSKKIDCMYIIVGVTSNGEQDCATPHSAGVYTKVAAYVPWIESIVWPQYSF